VTSEGEVRAYAGFDRDAVKKLARRKKDVDNHYYHLIGKGYIAFTVDPGTAENTYQGIVELRGTSIVDAVQHYLTQSEQIKTSFKLAVHPQDSLWCTGAIMIQQLPGEEREKPVPESVEIEDWTRAAILLDTCTEGELLSPVLSSSDLLYRLFNEDGVRVYKPTHVSFKCRCSRDKVINILLTIPRRDMEEVCEQEGAVSITCEFCSQKFTFTKDDLEDIYREGRNEE
jgi:molecular chaperone Hsp33